MNKTIYYLPRILAILFVVFVSIFALDVFGTEASFWREIGGFLIHLIPSYILIIATIMAWKKKSVGGIIFILAGILYAAIILRNILTGGFEWYYLAWIIQISGIAFLIGILFLVAGRKK